MKFTYITTTISNTHYHNIKLYFSIYLFFLKLQFVSKIFHTFDNDTFNCRKLLIFLFYRENYKNIALWLMTLQNQTKFKWGFSNKRRLIPAYYHNVHLFKVPLHNLSKFMLVFLSEHISCNLIYFSQHFLQFFQN